MIRYLLNANRAAMLKTICWSEGTSLSPITKAEGFDVVVTGIDGKPEVFTDFSRHPFENRAPKVINSRGLESTAAGGPQILLRFWRYYQKLLNLPDFSRDSQEQYVMQQFKEHSALGLLDLGQFDQSVTAISGLWASFPGKQYVGQGQHTIDALRAIYLKSGGNLHPDNPA